MSDNEEFLDASPDTNRVNKVSVKIPPFWTPNPKLWFIQIESQFVTSGITADATKFHTVVAAIDSHVLAQVYDVIDPLPATGTMYDTLKKRIIKEFSESDQRKMKKLLSDHELGDKKPSALMREMRILGGANVSGELLKQLWLQRLPSQTAAILAVNQEDDCDRLAMLADRIHETTIDPQIMATSTSKTHVQVSATSIINTDMVNLQKQVFELAGEVDALRNRKHKGNSQQNRTNHRGQTDQEQCWYHRKYGNDAQKCRPPCVYSGNALAQR